MSPSDPTFTTEDLDRFVDAQLDSARRVAVAEHLAGHREDAEYVETQQRLNALLRARFDRVLDEPIPSALLRAATRTESPRQRVAWGKLGLAGALAALVALVGLGGWWLGQHSAGSPPAWTEFVRQAAYAHQIYAADRRHPVEFTAAQEHELLDWLSVRLGAPVRAPRLEQMGFRLLGGRLLPASDGPAAQLMYEDGSGRRMTLYLRADLPNQREVEFQFARGRTPPVLFWLDGPHAYALSGDLDRSELLRIAKVVYEQMES